MYAQISAKQLRDQLPEVVQKVRQGIRFTVLYRSRPAFQIVPVASTETELATAEADALYGAPAVGRSRDCSRAAHHDRLLYPRRRSGSR